MTGLLVLIESERIVVSLDMDDPLNTFVELEGEQDFFVVCNGAGLDVAYLPDA